MFLERDREERERGMGVSGLSRKRRRNVALLMHRFGAGEIFACTYVLCYTVGGGRDRTPRILTRGRMIGGSWRGLLGVVEPSFKIIADKRKIYSKISSTYHSSISNHTFKFQLLFFKFLLKKSSKKYLITLLHFFGEMIGWLYFHNHYLHI